MSSSGSVCVDCTNEDYLIDQAVISDSVSARILEYTDQPRRAATSASRLFLILE